VPDDFDRMGEATIAALFTGGEATGETSGVDTEGAAAVSRHRRRAKPTP
jgi:hypothetical protein